jgi:hypothetical protein
LWRFRNQRSLRFMSSFIRRKNSAFWMKRKNPWNRSIF